MRAGKQRRVATCIVRRCRFRKHMTCSVHEGERRKPAPALHAFIGHQSGTVSRAGDDTRKCLRLSEILCCHAGEVSSQPGSSTIHPKRVSQESFKLMGSIAKVCLTVAALSAAL